MDITLPATQGDSDVQVLMDYENTCAQYSKYANAGSKFRRQAKLLSERVAQLKSELIRRGVAY